MRRAPFQVLLAGLLFAGPALAQHVPDSSTISVRTLDEVSATRQSRGHAVRAMVLLPLRQASRLLVAPRTVIEGVVEDAGTEDARGARHSVQLHFTSMLLGDGTKVTISGRVTSVDNARESVDGQGRILGPPLPELARARSSWAALAVGTLSPVAGGVFFAAVRGEAGERQRRIDFAPGTDMTVRLLGDTPLPAWPEFRAADSLADGPVMARLVANLPLRATAAAGRARGDFVNIVFIGSAGQLQRAFLAAGWDVPDRMSTRSDCETFVKAAEARGYAHQPVSKQVLFGRVPDLVFQRVTDTFARRHHVRMWSTTSRWRGVPIWVGAATHDVGVQFSREHRGFTHRVDAAIDGERDKVVSDLVAYLQVARLSMLERTPIPDAATRGPVRSDWRVAAVRLTE